MRNIVLEQKESKCILAVVLSVCTKATNYFAILTIIKIY